MTHFHANKKTGPVGSWAKVPESLGTFHTREDASTALLQVIGSRLVQEPGWITRVATLPVDGIGIVQIENVVTGEEVSSALWGCGCTDGEREIEGTSSGAQGAAQAARARRDAGR